MLICTHYSPVTLQLPFQYYKVTWSGGCNAIPDQERVITADRGITCWQALLASPPGVGAT